MEPSPSDQLDVERLIHAGVYDPDAPNAADRLELVRYLLDIGISQDRVEEVFARRGLAGLIEDLQQFPLAGPGDLVDLLISPVRLSAREIAARLDTDIEFVAKVRSALGFAPVDPDDAVLAEPLVDDFAGVLFGIAMFGEESILALLRVMASAAVRLAETTQAMMFSELAPELLAQPGGELAVLKANTEATFALPLIPKAFANAFYEHVNAASDRFRGGFQAHAAMQSVDIAIAFVDLVSSTEWAERISRQEHNAALGQFERRAAELATSRGCRVVKTIGDEVMVVGFDATSVCKFARTLCREIRDELRLPDARGGVAFGPVVAREGDYFGPPVNLAARCVKTAPASGVVVTGDVLTQVATEGNSIDTSPLGRQTLRGVSEDVELYLLA